MTRVVTVGETMALLDPVEDGEPALGDGVVARPARWLLEGWDPAACARAGHVIAGWALRGTGDWETLPRLDEVRDLLRG